MNHEQLTFFDQWIPCLQDTTNPTLVKEWRFACEMLAHSGITRAEFEEIDLPGDDAVSRIFDVVWKYTCMMRQKDFVSEHPSIEWVPRLILEDRASWPYKKSEGDALSRIERWEQLCLKIEADRMTPDVYSEPVQEDHRYPQIRNATRICYIEMALKQWPYILATRILNKPQKKIEFVVTDKECKKGNLYNRLRAENPDWTLQQIVNQISVIKTDEELIQKADRILAEAKKRLEEAEFERAVQAKMVELAGEKLTPRGP